jgi:serine/threonine-protein kinase
MAVCPTCKQNLAPGVRFCPHDGTPVAETSPSTVRTPAGDFEIRPPSQELDLPAMVGGRYRLAEYKGGGGMAKVYRGIDTTLERDVAVKLINPELRNDPEFDARFQREARIASQLSDPHIVVVHDFGLDPQLGPFLVMEYLQGQSLRDRLHAEGPLPLKAGLQLGGQLILALMHAHDKGIVHRDIKPDNIFLLNQSGVRLHVRVLDFGIARIVRGDQTARVPALTAAGAVLGTPRYMSPEQLAGQTVDARSDLYSAALVIHEALTGQLPYVSGKTLCELCPDATPALQDLLDRCLRQNPLQRPASAVEVYLRLQELGKASGVLLLPPGAMDKLLAIRRQPTDQTEPPPTVAAPPEVDTAATAASYRRQKQRMLLVAVGLVLLLVMGLLALLWLLRPAS